MKLKKILAAGVGCITITACTTTTEIYPICNFNDDETSSSLADRGDVRKTLANTVNQATSENAKWQITSSVIIVTAYKKDHLELKKIWPSIACIGKRKSYADEVLFRECQRKITQFIDYPWRSWPGPFSKGPTDCGFHDT